MSLGDYFSILLGHSDDLSHILHASDRLADLPSHCDERLATIRPLLALFIEVGSFARILLIVPRHARQLHQVCHFALIHLHYAAVDETVAVAGLLRLLDQVLCRLQRQVNVDVAAE